MIPMDRRTPRSHGQVHDDNARFHDLGVGFYTTRIDPEGPAAPGQTVHAWTSALGRRWAVSLQIEAVAPEGHQIRLRTQLPLGVSVVNQISCTALGPSSCRVQFG